MADIKHQPPGANLPYLVVVSVLTFLLPATGTAIEAASGGAGWSFALFCKWFIFSAVGLRLLLAGLRQMSKPAFTAKEIFHIESPEVLPIVRELGFANLCFGLVGVVAFFKPEWRVVSAFGSGLYYGLAGVQHLVKRPAGINEQVALWTDVIIFGVLLAYVIRSL